MGSQTSRDRLMTVIRSVRRRWRLRVILRGLAIVLGAGLIVFLVSAYGMDRLRFTTQAVLVFRVVAYAGLLALTLRFLVWPLSRRVSDERIALYLEEHEPSLELHLLSALEFSSSADETAEGYSPDLVARLVENAAAKCAAVDDGRRLERRALARSSGWLAGTSLAALVLLLVAPPFVRHSTPFLLPWGTARASSPYSIEVAPGDARIARGSELKISARLVNFGAEDVEIAVRRGDAAEWERFPMGRDDESADFIFFLFDLNVETEYFVEAGGVRSQLFRVEVAELPYVQQLTLEYHFPSYTGLQPVRQEDGGDIAALRGTDVRVWVTPTIPVAGGWLVIDEADSLALEMGPEGTLTGGLRVARDGMYRVVFEPQGGGRVEGSPDYLIDVLADQPPSVRFSKPGRDIEVTNVEEVFVEVEAQDDYGIGSLELIYAINGGAEDTLALYRGGRREVSAGHTYYLEDLDLQPGDFLSYYARATDGNRVGGRQTALTDIYFMEVRPYDRRFHQAEQAGMQGGAPAGFESSLAEQQRDIIAATFNVIRDRDRYSADELSENIVTLALAQGKLRQQVETLLQRIQSRGIVQMDSGFASVVEALPIATEAMRRAEERLGAGSPAEALPPEQQALQQLQRAEAAFNDVQVGRDSQQGGGGGLGNAEELAELFELELDKQRNQYEQVQRDRQQQVSEELDATLQKLQELARRQQQETERLRAQAGQAQSQSGGGASQRQLAAEAEELARRLERLAREESRPELQRTVNELRQAAEEMRRAAANARNGGAAQGQAALERLREARRALEQNRSQGLERQVDDALNRTRRLAEQQRDVIGEVNRIGESQRDSERMQRLLERKEAMAGEVADLASQLDRLALESRSEQRDASRKLQDAANSIRDDKLEEKLLYSRGVIQQRSPEYARNFEEQIERDIDNLQQRIEDARQAIGESREQRLARSLDHARDLARSLESLEERTADRAEANGEAGGRGTGRGEPNEGEPNEGERPAGQPSQLESGDGFPGFAPGDVRQFQREFQERRGEAEQLRQELERDGIDTSELRSIADRLAELERQGAYSDPRALAVLQQEIIRDLKEFEYVLRRQLGGNEARQLLLSGSDEVPPEYRALVEEYYKSLGGERRE